MSSISDIRKEYSKESLDIAQVSPDPMRQFQRWFDEALRSEVLEVNAMTLSTVNKEGKPSARIVLLKGIEKNQFQFFTNYQSKKGKELFDNPACALTFFWPELERQVRVEGIALRLEENLSIQYFQSRPRNSQVGAWASPQSALIENREILEQRVKEIEKKFESHELLPKPHQWGGFSIEPHVIEFWQGRPNRLHDRIIYHLIDGRWHIHRLAP